MAVGWPSGRSASSRSFWRRSAGVGHLDESATNTFVVAAIISISLNPVLYRLVHQLESRAKPGGTPPEVARRSTRLWRNRGVEASISPTEISPEPSTVYQAVVVGYGPVGCTVARFLRENSVEPTIIELNLETVRQASRGRNGGRLWRREPRRIAQAGRHRPGDRARAQRGESPGQPGNDSHGPRTQSSHSRFCADELSARNWRFEKSGART